MLYPNLSSGLLAPSASCQIKFRLFVCLLALNTSNKSWEWYGVEIWIMWKNHSPHPAHAPSPNKQNKIKSVLKFFHTEMEVNNYLHFSSLVSRICKFPSNCLYLQCFQIGTWGVACTYWISYEEGEILSQCLVQFRKGSNSLPDQKVPTDWVFPTFYR